MRNRTLSANIILNGKGTIRGLTFLSYQKIMLMFIFVQVVSSSIPL
ncbi:MAG: hypothetical protein GX121_05650 [Ignavibacteria bacterium]|nr:hypothetical protein [Ignavibacteria bacterium]